MTAADENVRPVDHAREARYAEAIMGGKERADLLAVRNPGEVVNAHRDARAVVAVADAEREQDAATIAELRAEVERLRSDKAAFERWRDQWIIDMESTVASLARVEDDAERVEERLRAVEAAIEGKCRYPDEHKSCVPALVRAALASSTSPAEQEAESLRTTTSAPPSRGDRFYEASAEPCMLNPAPPSQSETVEVFRGWVGFNDGNRTDIERWVQAADGDWISLDSTIRTTREPIVVVD